MLCQEMQIPLMIDHSRISVARQWWHLSIEYQILARWEREQVAWHLSVMNLQSEITYPHSAPN